MSEKWRIERLSELAQAALDQSSCDSPTSGRVREVPDVRTIRYYTTRGLLDRATEIRGRTAYYGRKHLLQLVGIKRLQSQGLSLVEIQRKMVGLGDRQLVKLADLPSGFFADALSREIASDEVPAKAKTENKDATTDVFDAEQSTSESSRFWAKAPRQESRRTIEASSIPPVMKPATILPIANGVSLLIENLNPELLDEKTQQALASAMANLKETLRDAGIV